MSAEYTNYNYDELWALHLVGDCPWDCPFCFDDEDREETDPWSESDNYEDYSDEEYYSYFPEEEPSEG